MPVLTVSGPVRFHARQTRVPVDVEPVRTPAIEVSLVLEGSITYRLDGRYREVKAPAATLAFARESFEVFVPARSPTRTVWCHTRDVRLSSGEWGALERLRPLQPVSERLLQLFSLGLSTAPQIGTEPGRPDFAAHVRGALALAIIGDYALASAGADRATSLPTGVAAVKHHLDTRFAEPCTTSNLAAIAGLNPTYLIDRFRREFGMPPTHYLWQRRVEAGVRLLQQTRLSCEEIAHVCGFQSAAHFSRKVKALRQATPRELRAEFVGMESQ